MADFSEEREGITSYVPKPKVRSYWPPVQGIRALFGRSGLLIGVSEIRGIVREISAASGDIYMAQNPVGEATVTGQGVVKAPGGQPVSDASVTALLDGQELWVKKTDDNGAVPFGLAFSEEGEHLLEMYLGEKPSTLTKRTRYYSSILLVVYMIELKGVANPDPWLRYNGRAIVEDLDPVFWTNQLRNVIGLIGGSFTHRGLLPVLKGTSVKYTYGNSSDSIFEGQPEPQAWWDCTISTKSTPTASFVPVASGRVNRRNFLAALISY